MRRWLVGGLAVLVLVPVIGVSARIVQEFATTVRQLDRERPVASADTPRKGDGKNGHEREKEKGGAVHHDPKALPPPVGPGGGVQPYSGVRQQERMIERADVRGITVPELREQLASRDGLNVQQYMNRRERRAEWREGQSPEDLRQRRDERHARQAEMPAEELAELQEEREQRRAMFEADPSLKDAANVLRTLDQVVEKPPTTP